MTFDPDEYPDLSGGTTEETPYDVIFDAPDYSSLIRNKPTPVSREYTTRVRSLIKTGALACIRGENFPDAAALLEYGDQWARAAGDLASESDKARRYMDIITAPESPYLAFAMTSMTLFSQLARNHAAGLETAKLSRKAARQKRKADAESGITPEGSVTWKIPIIRREVRLGFRIRPKAIITRALSVFKGTTLPPADLTMKVFTDDKLIKALADQGIAIRRQDG